MLKLAIYLLLNPKVFTRCRLANFIQQAVSTEVINDLLGVEAIQHHRSIHAVNRYRANVSACGIYVELFRVEDHHGNLHFDIPCPVGTQWQPIAELPENTVRITPRPATGDGIGLYLISKSLLPVSFLVCC
jgi:hypothetical protein